MPLPLAVAVPMAAASLAYLNARMSLDYDYHLIYSKLMGEFQTSIRDRRDRLNGFYNLEERAQSGLAEKPFIHYQGTEWTYKETYEMVLRYGTWLKTRYGVRPKEIVAMDFMNSDNFLFIWLGLWSIGARPAFINYNLSGKPLLHCVRTSTTRLLIVDEAVKSVVSSEVAEELRTLNGGVEVVFFDSALEAEARTTTGIREPDATRSGVQTQDMAILIYTSGTTGLPKPAIVSWNKVNFPPRFVFRFLKWGKEDRMYTCMPLYHSSAALFGFWAALVGGSSIAIGRKFSTKNFWREARESNSTLIQYVGETCRYLLAAPPEVDPVTGENLDGKNGVRLAFGNGLRPDVWLKFKERFGIETIVEFYAATEGMSGSWNFSRNGFSQGAIGRNGTLARFVLGTELAVLEIDWESEAPWRNPVSGRCKKVQTGEAGELLYKLDAKNIRRKFQGYFGNDKASEGKIMRDVLAPGDAWFRTGDLVRWDAEGRWYFSDRLGDTFRWKSENVSTSEVSEVLGHHPAIREANVYGVSVPHHDGRAGCAAVVFSPTSTSPGPALPSDSPTSTPHPSPTILASIAQHVQSQLPRYAVPIFLRVGTDNDDEDNDGSAMQMQRTGTNKQQKHELRNQGVDPEKVSTGPGPRTTDRLYWFNGTTYVPFGKREWQELGSGAVKL
ncbi:MAG: hypothetical protein M1837_001905 [Sclerophora amabilis]|nr:MAG: hypothetical protein M1837_001905 [Sclerophora amabilis]